MNARTSKVTGINHLEHKDRKEEVSRNAAKSQRAKRFQSPQGYSK